MCAASRAMMPRGMYVDDKVMENLQFHQETVASDSNSPLHLIREKEIEISGRMLAAKRQADEIVADARKKAAALMGSATDEAGELAKKHEADVQAQLKEEIESVRAQAAADVDALEGQIAQRRSEAVSYVVRSVLGD